MSNQLSIRRVKVQDLDDNGNPDGLPTFGVIAFDDYECAICDVFESFEDLETFLETNCECLLDVIGKDVFREVDRSKLSFSNYLGEYPMK